MAGNPQPTVDMWLFALLLVVPASSFLELNFGSSQAFSKNYVDYQDSEGTTLRGFLVVPKGVNAHKKRPAVILFHAFTGRGDFDDGKAIEIAKMGYVAFAADTYGKNWTFTSLDASFAMMGAMMGNRTTTLRSRILAAWSFVNNLSFVDKNRIASIGFCYGGLCSLDLARFDVGARAIVAFHPDLTNYPGNNTSTRTSIQVHHGDADLFTTNEHAEAFLEEVRDRKADWVFTRYANAQHAFTLPGVDSFNLTGAAYNPTATKRAWAAMEDFLKEKLA